MTTRMEKNLVEAEDQRAMMEVGLVLNLSEVDRAAQQRRQQFD